MRAEGCEYTQIAEWFGTSAESVRMALRRSKPPAPRAFSVERILVLPDSHFPFVSKQAWAVAMAAGRGFKPDRIIHLGDLWDMFAISDYPKTPDRKTNLEAEIKSGSDALDELGTLGASRMDICLGNHEDRWDRYLTQNAPELFNLLRFGDVVRFKERGWHVTPYKRHLTVGKMHFTHEVGYCGKQAHVQSRQEFEGNCVIGHTHGLASEYKGNLLGSAHVGIQLGWLGDKDAIDYAHQRRSASWVHAFGIAYHEPNGNVHVLPTPIVCGSAVVEGRVYSAPESVRSAA
jgi:predicted phosphodiesterase